MSNTLRSAAMVVGAVALVATGVGAAAGIGLAVSATTLATAATVASVAAFGVGVLGVAAVVTAKKPGQSTSGNQTKFTFSADQGIPFAMGRTAVAGWGVHRQTWDQGGSKNNAYQTFFGVWSWGRSLGTNAVFQVDGTTVAFAVDPNTPTVPDRAVGAYHDWMWLRTQAGGQPEASALQATGFYPYPAGWSASSKMSGYTAFAWTLKFDEKGKAYPGGAVPQPRRIDDFGPVYDPRQDSTFPGGSGPCRAGNEGTYVFAGIDSASPANRNPWLQALTWAVGHFANGKRALGIGMAIASIDVAAYAHAANIADANEWTIGGTVYSTDGKYDVLKKMCAAGGGEPLQLGGTLSCSVEAPRVSLATITDDDIIGRCTIPGSSRSKDRINAIIPKYRSEEHDWQLVDAAKVSIDSYATLDGRTRTKAVTWELVQDVEQVAELATYEIVNAREIDGIVLPLKIRWIGYKPGDAITVASSTVAMDNQLVVIRRRNLDPSTGAVTLTLRTETTEKHAFALGKTTTPPPQPALQTVDRGDLLWVGDGGPTSWVDVIDDDPDRPKPEDGATNSADPNSAFGDKTVGYVLNSLGQVTVEIPDLEAVKAALNINILNYNDLAQLTASRDAVMLARTTLGGQAIGTVVSNLVTVTDNTVESVALMGSKDAAGTSFIMNLNTVKTDASTTLAQYFTSLVSSSADGVVGAQVQALQQAIASGDAANAQTISTVATNLGNLSSQVSFFTQATTDSSGNTLAKAVLSLKSNGRVGGMIAQNDGNVVTLDLDFDRLRIFRPDGVLLLRAGDTAAGESANAVYAPNLIVDTLKVNTAMVPVRVASTSNVTTSTTGSASNGDILQSQTQVVMSVVIKMPVPGWIEVTASAKLRFSDLANLHAWACAVDVNGTLLPEAYSYGQSVGDSVSTFGALYASVAGNYTVNYRFAAHSSIQLQNRSMFAKGIPFTS